MLHAPEHEKRLKLAGRNDFVQILRWDQSKHPRDKEGKFTDTVGTIRGEVRSTAEQARRDMLALGKKVEKMEKRHSRAADVARKAYETWWAALSTGRKKPLKPDGAAAKRLPEWKAAQEADAEVMRIAGEAQTVRRKANEEALRQLEVPQSERSKVQFLVPRGQLHSDPGAEAGIAHSAARALDKFRKYDGSGELIGHRFEAEKVEEVRKLLGPNVTFDMEPDGSARIATRLRLTMAPPGQRANASPFGVQIRGTRDLERVVNHEVAHHIEFKSGKIYDAAVALRAQLATDPQVTKSLNELRQTEGYGIDEIAIPGRFLEPYTGKVYPSEAKATEIISMGVEHYLSDPIRFAREAPEHFRLIWDVMHGKYRETD